MGPSLHSSGLTKARADTIYAALAGATFTGNITLGPNVSIIGSAGTGGLALSLMTGDTALPGGSVSWTSTYDNLGLVTGGAVTITGNGSLSLDTSGTGMAFKFNGTTVAKITGTNVFLPGSNDGTSLGSGTLSFSDLFLASGAVINFNNGDVTLTHGSNLLTVAGGEVSLTGRQTDFTALTGKCSIGNSSTGYPGIGYNVTFVAGSATYNYTASDTAFMVHLGGTGGTELALNTAASGTAGNAITWVKTLAATTTGVAVMGTLSTTGDVTIGGAAATTNLILANSGTDVTLASTSAALSIGAATFTAGPLIKSTANGADCNITALVVAASTASAYFNADSGALNRPALNRYYQNGTLKWSAGINYDGTDANNSNYGISTDGTLANEKVSLSATTLAVKSQITTTKGVSGGTALTVGGTNFATTSVTDNITAVTSNNAFISFGQMSTIKANTLTTGTWVKIYAVVRVTQVTAVIPSLTCQILFGGAAIIVTTAVIPTAAQDVHILEMLLTCKAAPSAGSAFDGGGRWITNNGGTIAHGTYVLAQFPQNFATNADITVAVQAKWSTNAANNSARLVDFIVEIGGA